MGKSDPSLVQVVSDMIEARLTNLHTMLPGKVNRVDVKKGVCDVQPLIKRKYPSGEIVDLPVISNVPIANYRAGKAFITLPVKKGDLVEVRFSERSLDLWLSLGGQVDPKDPRKHHLSDAVAYPGMYPFNDPPDGASADDIIIKNDKSVITIKPSGKYLFTNGTNEIMDVMLKTLEEMIKVADKLSTTTTNTALGPMKLNDFSAFAANKSEFEALKSKWETLKG